MASTSTTAWSTADSVPPAGYLSRKALPIKRNDAESLTREDVQYDLLTHIFSDTKAVFTHPTAGNPKITFRELYINALYSSSKCSKVLKEKMVETPAFALEFSKICLLTNVGRINTTMAFFPEMKTALRTYHPVPSLQKTDGNAQDAPRIKNCLKAALLPSELKTLAPSSPEEVHAKLREGKRPPTSVVNLIFVLSNHAAPLARTHFDGPMNFLDFFLPKPFASIDRARAFLWFIYHYLESPRCSNPFDDDFSRENAKMAPKIRLLSPSAAALENVDTEDEIIWGNTMSNQRNIFLHKLVSSIETDKKIKPVAPHFVPEPSSPHETRGMSNVPDDATPFMFYVPGREPTSSRGMSEKSDTPLVPADMQRRHRHYTDQQEPRRSLRYHRHQPVSPTTASATNLQHPHERHKPTSIIRPQVTNQRPDKKRSMVQQAFYVALHSDPLADSDEENADDDLIIDYRRRLEVLSRIRGRPPTPDPQPPEEQHFYTAVIS